MKKLPEIDYICEYCGKFFVRPHGHKYQFCSIECTNKSFRKVDKSTYDNRNWLYNQYIVNGKSLKQLAKMCKVSRWIISHRLNEFQIPVRSIGEGIHVSHTKKLERYKDRDWLYDQYIIQRKTGKSIGKSIGKSESVIYLWLKKYNIPRRNGVEIRTGYKTTEETKRNQSIAQKKIGNKPPNRKGFIMPEEHKQKISAANQGILYEDWDGYVSFEPYGEEFNDSLREKIRKRDNYTCQECGKTQEKLGRKLAVHHIDYDKTNNDEDNLISLCHSCHSKTNFNRDDWTIHYKTIRANIKIVSGQYKSIMGEEDDAE